MALKDNKPRLYSTFWDVVSAAQQIATEQVDMSSQSGFRNVIKYKAQVEMAILQARVIIQSALTCLYGESDFRSLEAPWMTPPVPTIDNNGDTELISVEIDPTQSPYTAAWVLTFSEATVFGAFSSLEGIQSITRKTGGSITTDFTPTNADFTISKDAWFEGDAAFKEGDSFWFSVIDVHPLIWHISNMIATSKALKEIYTAESPNLSDQGEDLYKKAMTLLARLQKPNTPDGLMLTCLADTISPDSIPVVYGVDFLGTDRSPYLDPTQVGEAEL